MYKTSTLSRQKSKTHLQIISQDLFKKQTNLKYLLLPPKIMPKSNTTNHTPYSFFSSILINLIHTFFLPHLVSLSLITTPAIILMEANIALCVNDKKENIFPFSENKPNPVVGTSKSSKKMKKRRLMRKPLADITHLFTNSDLHSSSFSSPSLQLFETATQLRFPCSVVSSSDSAAKSRKRKTKFGDMTKRVQNGSNSISLRMGFR